MLIFQIGIKPFWMSDTRRFFKNPNRGRSFKEFKKSLIADGKI
ncbi:MAG: hypothetical protein ACI9IP_001078 [Arcticibacterium sp.]|jgi:hypothetical protein